ncbi:hypothetical protein BJ138DRAFT_1165866 [Hygrophoropsis aurantiaca]|uniref:Uncharacterized protein n=1 Tax=Hygrophoropsis aurantiaca TaxID=72124 RepID=A0ACB7ZVD0_9AGAM|nr:hypothetical protein BJ138DRAFT_1165866 [Hygrophoropsis aurantiaca]
MCSRHLSYAWWSLTFPSANQLSSDAWDEALPNFFAFTIRHQTCYESARTRIHNFPRLLLYNLQKNLPESPSIKPLQEMISKLPPYK